MKYNIPELKVVSLSESSDKIVFDGPEKVWEVWDSIKAAPWFDYEKECLVVVALDTKNKTKGFFLISIGTVNQTMAHPREILKPVIVSSAAAFVLIHNHPSGDTEPSLADITATNLVREAAKMMQITFSDHLIVGEGEIKNYYSFREAGRL